MYKVFDFRFNLRTVLIYGQIEYIIARYLIPFLPLVGATWLKHDVGHCKSFLLGEMMDMWLVCITAREIIWTNLCA
jgi:hypothetical protein